MRGNSAAEYGPLAGGSRARGAAPRVRGLGLQCDQGVSVPGNRSSDPLPEIEKVRPAHQALNRSAEDDSQESGAHRRLFCCKLRLLS